MLSRRQCTRAGSIRGAAVKFTGSGGRVDIEAGLLDSGELRILISDTGIGMDDRELEIALSRFGQVGNHMTREHQGTGLGLPLAVELAKIHGASVHVTSEKNAGTRVAVNFPEARVINADQALATRRTDRQKATA